MTTRLWYLNLNISTSTLKILSIPTCKHIIYSKSLERTLMDSLRPLKDFRVPFNLYLNFIPLPHGILLQSTTLKLTITANSRVRQESARDSVSLISNSSRPFRPLHHHTTTRNRILCSTKKWPTSFSSTTPYMLSLSGPTSTCTSSHCNWSSFNSWSLQPGSRRSEISSAFMSTPLRRQSRVWRKGSMVMILSTCKRYSRLSWFDLLINFNIF